MQKRLQQLREQYQRERQEQAAAQGEQSAQPAGSQSQDQPDRPSQMGQSGQSGRGSQMGQSGQGDASGDELSPEQKRRMLEMIAKRKQEFLDNLPKDVPGQIKSLTDYDFMDDEAREKFQELLASLQHDPRGYCPPA